MCLLKAFKWSAKLSCRLNEVKNNDHLINCKEPGNETKQVEREKFNGSTITEKGNREGLLLTQNDYSFILYLILKLENAFSMKRRFLTTFALSSFILSIKMILSCVKYIFLSYLIVLLKYVVLIMKYLYRIEM